MNQQLNQQLHRIGDIKTMKDAAMEAPMAAPTEAQDDGLKWWNFSTSDVIKYLSVLIVIWMIFAVYSYLHNQCELYGGSYCEYMNPLTCQNCVVYNYIF